MVIQQLGFYIASTSRDAGSISGGGTKIPKLQCSQKKNRVQKNVCVMFIAVGKRTEEFVRKHVHTYIHICTYIYIYAYIHMFCKCIDMSGMVQKGLAIVIASKGSCGWQILSRAAHLIQFQFSTYILFLLFKK